MHEHVLAGCRPVPLASYLKALAVLRLVAEQADPRARGFWRNDTFVVRTSLDRDALLRFFIHEYRPTPIVAPWNGGSGFYVKDNQQAIQQLSASTTPRFEVYRAAIAAARNALSLLNITEKVSGDKKPTLLETCRGTLPDDALAWLDAAYLLTVGGPKYPPLLGTGGNDGRLDFTNNFMQRLLDVLDAATGGPTSISAELLAASLMDDPTDQHGSGAIGQFLPAGAGGANAGTGFDGSARHNAWDFVLMLEGACTFAAVAVRKMERETRAALSYPFTARTVGTGYASASAADEADSRGEMWLPIWTDAATSPEIHALFGEGRARVANRTARNGVDFARAAATLGFDRGITRLQRYGFQKRNGRTYLATPLEPFRVHEQPTARLLDPIDPWLDVFRRRATGERAPASARRALAVLDHAIVDLCRRSGPDHVQSVLVALGACERMMARSVRWVTDPKSRLAPVPPLSTDWLLAVDDGSPELRLAASLASVAAAVKEHYVPLRRQMEPVAVRLRRHRLRVEWDPTADRDVAFGGGDLASALNAVLARRLLLCEQWGVSAYPDDGVVPAHLGDIAAFVEGRTDDARLEDLLWGMILIDWPGCERAPFDPPRERIEPPALYALLKLCFPGGGAPTNGSAVPAVPRIHRLAASGDGALASRTAARRLRASGLSVAVDCVHQVGDPVRRAAASVLFPLDRGGLAAIRRSVLRPTNQPGETTP